MEARRRCWETSSRPWQRRAALLGRGGGALVAGRLLRVRVCCVRDVSCVAVVCVQVDRVWVVVCVLILDRDMNARRKREAGV